MEFPENHVYNEISYYLKEGGRSFGLHLSDEHVKLFVHYYYILTEVNQKVNLTHITAPSEVAVKHFIDSLVCTRYEDVCSVKNIIDVGTGAGFPGLPLKIVFPGLNLTLLDSLKKRTEFLKSVVNTLLLENVHIFHGRAEDFGRSAENREFYDLCFSRAVASLNILAELCLPLVKVGGKFLALKGPEIDNEINAAKKAIDLLGGDIEGIKNFNLPFSGDGRSIVIIKKIKSTPKKYPRRAGIPSKRPL